MLERHCNSCSSHLRILDIGLPGWVTSSVDMSKEICENCLGDGGRDVCATEQADTSLRPAYLFPCSYWLKERAVCCICMLFGCWLLAVGFVWVLLVVMCGVTAVTVR